MCGTMVDEDQRARLVMWTLLDTTIGWKREIHLVTFFFLPFFREKSGKATLKLCDVSQEGREIFLCLSQLPSTRRNSSSQGVYVNILS